MIAHQRPIPVKMTVIDRRWITPTVFILECTIQPRTAFKAGQFASIVIPPSPLNAKQVRRAYSIASEPENPKIEFCIKVVENGPGTQYLLKIKPGEDLQAFMPYGDFTYRTPSTKDVCLISTGTGLAPFRSMLRSSFFKNQPPQKIFCLLGVRTEDELLYEEELQKYPALTWIPAVSQPKDLQWPGFKGRVTDYFRSTQNTIPWKNTDFYLCGNGAMIQEMMQILTDNGVDKKEIFREIYYK